VNAIVITLALLSTPMATDKCTEREWRIPDRRGLCHCLAQASIEYGLCRAGQLGECEGKYVRARSACKGRKP
jgi:hypothetical protein